MQAQTDRTIDLQKVTALHFTDLEALRNATEGEETLPAEQTVEHGFRSLNFSQKRFHVLFYMTAALTGVLIVQTLWQIAILTIPM